MASSSSPSPSIDQINQTKETNKSDRTNQINQNTPTYHHIAPTPFRVSTITAVGGVNTPINLDILFDCICIERIGPEVQTHTSLNKGLYEEDFSDGEAFVYITYSRSSSKKKEAAAEGSTEPKPAEGSTVCERGLRPGKVQGRGKVHHQVSAGNAGNAKSIKKKSRTFDNQATVVYTCRQANLNLNLNMKVFKNGNVQITGIKDPGQGLRAIDFLIQELRRIHTTQDARVVANLDDLKNTNFKVCLVNTDFHLGTGIRRNVLHEMIATGRETHSSFEPCIYPGVKIDYYYNDYDSIIKTRPEKDEKNHAKGDFHSRVARGVCCCNPMQQHLCTGRGRGHGDGDCRKVTIAVFQSGCVIITGAHTLDQVRCAYEYITHFVDDVYEAVKKPNVT